MLAPFLAVFFPVLASIQPQEPFNSRNNRNLSLLFLRMPTKGQPLSPGEKALSIGWTESNDFRVLPGLREDYEITRLEFTGRWGWRSGEELWASAMILNRGGGFLDPWITGWHRNVLGWTDPNRDAAKNGGVIVSQAGRYSVGSAFGLGDTTLGWTKSLGPRTSMSAAIKLPTGDKSQLLGSGGVDAGFSLDHQFKLGPRWALHTQVGLVLQSPATKVKGARSWVDQQSFAILYQANSRDTWIGQWQSERAPVTTIAPGANATHRLLVLAYRRQLSARQTLELWFSEDRDVFNGQWPEGANLGPDFSAGVTLGWRF